MYTALTQYIEQVFFEDCFSNFHKCGYFRFIEVKCNDEMVSVPLCADCHEEPDCEDPEPFSDRYDGGIFFDNLQVTGQPGCCDTVPYIINARLMMWARVKCEHSLISIVMKRLSGWKVETSEGVFSPSFMVGFSPMSGAEWRRYARFCGDVSLISFTVKFTLYSDNCSVPNCEDVIIPEQC